MQDVLEDVHATRQPAEASAFSARESEVVCVHPLRQDIPLQPHTEVTHANTYQREAVRLFLLRQDLQQLVGPVAAQDTHAHTSLRARLSALRQGLHAARRAAAASAESPS